MHIYKILFKIDNFTINYYCACSWPGYVIRKSL